MYNTSYLVVSSIRDSEKEIVGYRVVDTERKKILDVSIDNLIDGVLANAYQFINTRIDFMGNLVFATQSGSGEDFPSLSLSGKRLLTSDVLTIGHSDSRGNVIAYDAHGEKHIIQPREYLSGVRVFTNAYVDNGGLIGTFITQRLDKSFFESNRFRIPLIRGSVMSV
jgi:hypothetical protein